jgi:hypothetical protein
VEPHTGLTFFHVQVIGFNPFKESCKDTVSPLIIFMRENYSHPNFPFIYVSQYMKPIMLK